MKQANDFIRSLIQKQYVIKYKQNESIWFLYDIDTRKPIKQVLWSQNIDTAIHFVSKTEATNIKRKHLGQYDVEIIKISKEEEE